MIIEKTFFKNIFKVLNLKVNEKIKGNYKRTKLLNFKFKTNKNENEINNDINKNYWFTLNRDDIFFIWWFRDER